MEGILRRDARLRTTKSIIEVGMQKISPMLWFDNQAEEAAKFYCSVFKNSRMGSVSHYGEGMPMPKGTVLVAEFFLDGQKFSALNGGPLFKFNESVSFVVDV